MLHPSTDIIMNAQQFFAADQSEANLVKLLHAVSVMLQEGAEVLIPTAADAPEGQLLLQTQTTDSRTLFPFGAVILLRWTATQLSMLPTARF